MSGLSEPQWVPMEDYPFPLANGQVGILRLPINLSSEDADRLAKYVRTLVVEDDEGIEPIPTEMTWNP